MSERLDLLLTMVADRPECERVNLSALARAFTPTVTEVARAIEKLIARGELDRLTLRRPIETPARDPTPALTEPPAPKAVAEGEGAHARIAQASSPSGSELVKRILAFIERHNLGKTAVSVHLFKNTNGLTVLHYTRRPKAATVEKITAFLAAEPPAKLRKKPRTKPNTNEPPVRSCPPPEAHLPTPQELAAEVAEFLKRTGTSKNAFGLKVIGSPSWAHNLAGRKRLKPEEVERARSLMATRPVDLKVNGRTRRDPTQPPDTPLMDYAERERMLAARAVQATKKRIRARAQKALDAGIPPAKASKKADVRGAMKELTENAEALARASDPLEQAKTLIRQRGYACFSASVVGGPKDRFYIGNRPNCTEAELLATAERLRRRV